MNKNIKTFSIIFITLMLVLGCNNKSNNKSPNNQSSPDKSSGNNNDNKPILVAVNRNEKVINLKAGTVITFTKDLPDDFEWGIHDGIYSCAILATSATSDKVILFKSRNGLGTLQNPFVEVCLNDADKIQFTTYRDLIGRDYTLKIDSFFLKYSSKGDPQLKISFQDNTYRYSNEQIKRFKYMVIDNADENLTVGKFLDYHLYGRAKLETYN